MSSFQEFRPSYATCKDKDDQFQHVMQNKGKHFQDKIATTQGST